MDLFQAIAQRHSYRGQYTAASVSRADLMQIVQAGIQAPSGKNEQVTSFVIVDDPACRAQVAAILNRPVTNTAQALIVCVTDNRPVFEGISFAAEDCAACVENMLLAITALGYASVWIDGALRLERRAERIAQLLGISAHKQVRIILPVGVPVEKCPQREKLPFDQRAWFNRYQAPTG